MMLHRVSRVSTTLLMRNKNVAPMMVSRSLSTTEAGDKDKKDAVNKAELIERVMNRFINTKKALPKVRYHEIAEALFEEIHKSVMENDTEVRIAKFGTFKAKHMGATKRRNPKTGETFTSEPKVRMSFHSHVTKNA